MAIQPIFNTKIAILALWRQRRWIGWVTFSFALVSAIYSLVITPTYRATATFIPAARTSGGLSDLTSNLKGTFAGGALAAITQKQDIERFMLILQSRTLAESVIKSTNLFQVLLSSSEQSDPFAMEIACNNLMRRMNFGQRRDGLFQVSADFETRELAVKVAQQYLTDLQSFINRSSLTLAKKNRIFIEEQLQKTSAELVQAEDAFRTFQQAHGLVALDAQVELSLRTIADIESSIFSKDIEINSIKGVSTSGNPDLARLIEERKALIQKRDKLLGQSTAEQAKMTPAQNAKDRDKKKDEGVMLTVQQAPGMGLDYVRLKRDVMIHEKTFELLTGQYQLAKIEEVKDDIAFQVLDPPALPKYRFSPKRKLNTLLGTLIGFLYAATWILTKERYPQISQTNAVTKLRRVFGRQS